MKKPNSNLKSIVRNLNLFCVDGNGYYIKQDNLGLYIEREFNDQYTLTLRSKWWFKSIIEIHLFKGSSLIDTTEVEMNATEVYLLERKIKDIELLVRSNWNGTKWDSVNDSERRGTWYTGCNQ
jgi:hypothetical protein